jgi:hypothetical protein
VQEVFTIIPVTDATPGTEWIGVSYDDRKAVFLPKYPSRTVAVLDFDTAASAKQFDIPAPPSGMGTYPFQRWLASLPGRGLVYVEHYGTADMKKLDSGLLTPDDNALRGMVVDASVPCDQSFFVFEPDDIKYLVASGEAGVADAGYGSTKDVVVQKDGSLRTVWFGGIPSYFGYRIPENATRGPAGTSATIVIANTQLLGLRFDTGLLVLRKSDNTWHNVPVPQGATYIVRGFGEYAAIIATQPKSDMAPESAGRAASQRIRAIARSS